MASSATAVVHFTPVLPSLRLKHCCFDVPCVSLDHRSLNIKHYIEDQWLNGSLALSSLPPLPFSPLSPLSLPFFPHPLPHSPVSLSWLCITTNRPTCKNKHITTVSEKRGPCKHTYVFPPKHKYVTVKKSSANMTLRKKGSDNTCKYFKCQSHIWMLVHDTGFYHFFCTFILSLLAHPMNTAAEAYELFINRTNPTVFGHICIQISIYWIIYGH